MGDRKPSGSPVEILDISDSVFNNDGERCNVRVRVLGPITTQGLSRDTVCSDSEPYIMLGLWKRTRRTRSPCQASSGGGSQSQAFLVLNQSSQIENSSGTIKHN